MQISGVSLALTTPSGFLYLEFSWVLPPLLQAFPFPSTVGEVTLHLLSQACVFIYSSHRKWVFTPSCGVFLPLPLLQAFPLLIAGRVPPLLLSLASLFIYSSMRDFPSPLFVTQGGPPSLLSVFFVIDYYLISLFSLGGGRSVQGAMLIWLRIVCGSTACCLAHLVVCIFPSSLGTGIWQHGGPPGFSV
jgi:hypothetical protein